MATKRIGGTAAKTGFYWNLGKWEMTMVPRQGGILPGDATRRYVKVPVLALLVVAPLMGAVYAILLPFVGLGGLFRLFGKEAAAAGAGASDAEDGDVVDPVSTDASVQGKQRTEPRRPDLHD